MNTKNTFSDYVSLVHFSHTVFALPFAIAAATYSFIENNNNINYWLMILIVLCMVFARTAAMAFNRLIDSDIDSANTRTENREIPKGTITKQNALWFVLLNSILFIGTTWCINTTVFYLSPIALFVVLGYSYTKRFTGLSHIVLGLGLALGPMGAYLAVYPYFNAAILFLSLSVLFWVAGFDIIYALQDYHFDKSNKLFSIPVLFGQSKALLISAIFHSICVFLLLYAGLLMSAGGLYYCGCVFFAWKLLHQHNLVSINDLSQINKAFFVSNGYASVIFCIFFITDLWV